MVPVTNQSMDDRKNTTSRNRGGVVGTVTLIVWRGPNVGKCWWCFAYASWTLTCSAWHTKTKTYMHFSSLVHVCAEVPIAKHASQCARVDRRFTIFTATRRDPFIIHILGCLYTCILLCIVFIYDYVCLLFCLVTKLPQAWNLPR